MKTLWSFGVVLGVLTANVIFATSFGQARSPGNTRNYEEFSSTRDASDKSATLGGDVQSSQDAQFSPTAAVRASGSGSGNSAVYRRSHHHGLVDADAEGHTTRALVASGKALSKLTSLDREVLPADKAKAEEVASALLDAAEAARDASGAIKLSSAGSPGALDSADISDKLDQVAEAVSSAATGIVNEAGNGSGLDKINARIRAAKRNAENLHKQNVAANRRVAETSMLDHIYNVREGMHAVVNRAMRDGDESLKGLGLVAGGESRPILSAQEAQKAALGLHRASYSAAVTSNVLSGVAGSRDSVVGSRPATINAHMRARRLKEAADIAHLAAHHLSPIAPNGNPKLRYDPRSASLPAKHAALNLRRHVSNAIGAATVLADDIDTDPHPFRPPPQPRRPLSVPAQDNFELSMMDSEKVELYHHAAELRQRLMSCTQRSHQLLHWNEHWRAVAAAEAHRVNAFQKNLENHHNALVTQQRSVVTRANHWAAVARLLQMSVTEVTPEKLRVMLLKKYSMLDGYSAALVQKSRELADLLATSESHRKDLIHFRRIGYALAAVCIIEVLLFAALGAYCIGRSSSARDGHEASGKPHDSQRRNLPTSSGVVELQDGEIKINNPNVQSQVV